MGQRAIETIDEVQRHFALACAKSGVSDVQVQQALRQIKEACSQVEDDGGVAELRVAAVRATESFLMSRCWNNNPLGLTKPVDEKLLQAAEGACAKLRAKLKSLPTDAGSRAIGLD